MRISPPSLLVAQMYRMERNEGSRMSSFVEVGSLRSGCSAWVNGANSSLCREFVRSYFYFRRRWFRGRCCPNGVGFGVSPYFFAPGIGAWLFGSHVFLSDAMGPPKAHPRPNVRRSSALWADLAPRWGIFRALFREFPDPNVNEGAKSSCGPPPPDSSRPKVYRSARMAKFHRGSGAIRDLKNPPPLLYLVAFRMYDKGAGPTFPILPH